MAFVKLYNDILMSTIWRESKETRILWITLLAAANYSGKVMASIPGLADAAHLTIEECEEALKCLESPDKYSRSQEYEGRRIERIDGGWLILNYKKYRVRRDRNEYMRNYMREQRNVSHVSQDSKHPLADTDTYTDTDTDKKIINKRKKFEPPSLEEVRQYISENPELKCVDPEDFWKGFNDSGWIDSRGNPVKNWKLKIRTWAKMSRDRQGGAWGNKTKLLPLIGKTCSKTGCKLPAVYKDSSGTYDHYYCGQHMPETVKAKHCW